MHLFRTLNATEIQEFRQWARQNYKPLTPIQGYWHPIIQQECACINEEARLELS